MWFTFLVGIELTLLYFVSRGVIQQLYVFFMIITRSRSISISAVTFLLFPGTVIHELSHLFTAEILGVRTGKLTLAPESIRGEAITTGSVAIAQTDPFRRYIIGLAPSIVGIAALSTLNYYFKPLAEALLTSISNHTLFTTPPLYLFLGLLYLMTVIPLTMFSSKEDLKGFLSFFLTLFLFGTALWIIGIRISLSLSLRMTAETILRSMAYTLGWELVLLAGLLLVGSIVLNTLTKLFHLHVVTH